MNISRLLPFLPLLMLLPAASSAALVFPSPNHPQLNPSELCPLVRIVEHELCINTQVLEHSAMHANNVSDLCVMLHNYNASFCSKKAHLMEHSPLSDDAMSVRILTKEFHDQKAQEQTNDKVCPILNFIEQELCTSRNEEIKVHFDPKQLCPLLNLTYTEFCEGLTQ
jgi:hypothetical protein